MSEVIARPAVRTRPKTVQKTPAKQQKNGFSPEALSVAFGIIEAELHAASRTDEPHDWSGDSDRLLRVASELAGIARIHTPDLDDAQRLAFDIAALVKASKLVPGDCESTERCELINQAAVQLNWLTECDEAGSNCIDPCAARPLRLQAPTSSMSPSERKVADAGAALMARAVKAIYAEDGNAFAAELLQLGEKVLIQASSGETGMGGARDVFFCVAGTCKGALAIEQADSPRAQSHKLIASAFDLLNTAGLSYDCELHPGVEAAAAIEAGLQLATTQQSSSDDAAEAIKPEGWDYPARGLANAAVCHLEAAVEVLRLIADSGSSDEVEGLRLLLEMVWSKHQSTDEVEDIGQSYMGAFADLQRELSVAYAMAQLVRLREEGAATGVSLLLQRAAELAEDALNAIPAGGVGVAQSCAALPDADE